MALFMTLIGKLIPLLLVIALGYISGTVLQVKKESIAILLLYVIAPVIVFHGVYTTPIGAGIIVLPLFFFITACVFSLAAYTLGKLLWKDNTRNIFAYAAGTGNTGYFGIPVALALLGDEVLGTVVLCTMGLIFFENSLGFFFSAKGNHTSKESIKKLLMLPSLYALALGLLLNALHVQIPESYYSLATNFRGAYTILGMMIVGLGVSGQKLQFDMKFLSSCFIIKFIVWPLYALLFVTLDRSFFHLLTPISHTIVLLLSIMPLAANTVVLATALNVQPGKAAMGVLITTLFALIYIPVMLTVFPL